jgi:SAM-dependent methyltransferase
MSSRNEREVHSSERVTESDSCSDPISYLIYCCHTATYDFARAQLSGRVLDFGCGTGYGTRRLADNVASVVGVDVGRGAIEYARTTYCHPNLDYRAIDPSSPLPFDDASFDAVVSFQVIEHVADPVGYLQEMRRVLRPGGCAMVATPDRTTRLFAHQRPWNEFHLVEYDAAGLEALIAPIFPELTMQYLHAADEVAQLELDRTRRLRALTLPWTFPGAPEWWRVGGMRALKALQGRGGRQGSAGDSPAVEFGFGPEAVWVDSNPHGALTLVAVIRVPAAAEPHRQLASVAGAAW